MVLLARELGRAKATAQFAFDFTPKVPKVVLRNLFFCPPWCQYVSCFFRLLFSAIDESPKMTLVPCGATQKSAETGLPVFLSHYKKCLPRCSFSGFWTCPGRPEPWKSKYDCLSKSKVSSSTQRYEQFKNVENITSPGTAQSLQK